MFENWKYAKLDKKTNRINEINSNIFSSRGSLESLYTFCVSPNGEPYNFLISGGNYAQLREQPLMPFVEHMIGRFPIILLHNDNREMERMIQSVWKQSGVDELACPLWIASNQTKIMEPCYGMTAAQIVKIVRNIARKLGYVPTPQLEKVVKAHLEILQILEIPASLTGLLYLCSFSDTGEFYNNIMELPCPPNQARMIWNNLGVDTDPANNQLDLFRSVMDNLAEEFKLSSWSADNSVMMCNILEAIKSGGIFSLSVNTMNAGLVLSYLADELKLATGYPFILLIDGISLRDEDLFDFICTENRWCRFGLISDNVHEMVLGDLDKLGRLANIMDTFIFFQHSNGRTADALSALLGTSDQMTYHRSHGMRDGWFGVEKGGKRIDIQYNTENRYRVMPENFQQLADMQAIIYTAVDDQITYYN